MENMEEITEYNEKFFWINRYGDCSQCLQKFMPDHTKEICDEYCLKETEEDEE